MNKKESRKNYIVEENLRRMNIVVDRFRKQPKNNHLQIKAYKSSKSNSLYMVVYVNLDDIQIKRTRRFSDHTISKKTIKNQLNKVYKIKDLERMLSKMIRSVNGIRLKVLLEKENERKN